MKKLLVTLLIAIVSLSLIGCFGEVTGNPSTSEKESERPTISVPESKPESVVESQPESESVTESVVESQPESETAPESQPESETAPESKPESESVSESVSESESEVESESESESEPETKTWIVTIVYQRVYGGQTYTQTIEVEEGVKTTITLPSIAVDTDADYEFSGWKIVETGVTYGASTTTIEVTCTSNITIKSQFVRGWAGPY